MRIFGALFALMAMLATAQHTTLDVFMPFAYFNDVEFAAEVIGVCSNTTTLGVQCTKGLFASTVTCGTAGPTFAITEDKTTYVATTSSSITGATETLTTSCALRGTTYASCETTVIITASGIASTRSTTNVMRGTSISQYYIYQMPVTLGVAKLTATACSGAVHAATPYILSVGAALVGILAIVL